jgi:hypothetical protein
LGKNPNNRFIIIFCLGDPFYSCSLECIDEENVNPGEVTEQNDELAKEPFWGLFFLKKCEVRYILHNHKKKPHIEGVNGHGCKKNIKE